MGLTFLGMPVVVSSALAEDEVALVVPGKRVRVELPDGRTEERLLKEPQVVLAKGVGR